MLGSKIDNLKLLKKHNISVPNFFVIEGEDVLNINYSSFNDVESIKKYILDNIKIKYKNTLNTKLYSVRSSCNLEDSESDSFAGQFDTYLNVTEEELDEKIKLCFLSLYNDNVFEYVKNNNIDFSLLKMNVIVQEMVSSTISGVFFTSNPQGILNESVIAVAKGLGENVVQDKGEVTSYYYNNTDNIYYYDGKDILDIDKINKLLEVSKKIIELLGDYLDIEFAFENDTLYILQVRKITTINDNNVLVLDNSNIVESYPNLSLPLTISFVNNVYSSVFKGVTRRILKDDEKLKEVSSVFNNMTGSVNGRVYYKISNWYTLIQFLPFSKKIIPVWQEMLGVKIKSYNDKNIKFNFYTRFKTYYNSLYELLHVSKNMDKLNEEFKSINKYFYDNFNEDLSNEEIIKLYRKVEKKLLNNWDITLINDLYTFIFTGLLKKHLKNKYKENYNNITNEYISGISNIESLKPIKELINLAYNEKNCSDDEFLKLKEEYISIYGDRSLEELKLESKTFRSNRELLDKKIREYQVDLDKLEEMYKNINDNTSIELDGGFITKFLTKRVMCGIKNREVSRLNRSRIYGMVRTMFLAIGKNLVKDNVLLEERDIFYLTLDEVFSKDVVDYKNVVLERKKKYKSYELLPSYSRLVFMNKEFDKNLNNIKVNSSLVEVSEISGTPCSFGEVEGEVLVIDDINNIKDVKNKILVTKMTDPGWVFLLATAKGIISEKGSLLSHTAIISRELKIPSIVGVDNLMKILHTGDIIRMNASTGVIKIIKRK